MLCGHSQREVIVLLFVFLIHLRVSGTGSAPCKHEAIDKTGLRCDLFKVSSSGFRSPNLIFLSH